MRVSELKISGNHGSDDVGAVGKDGLNRAPWNPGPNFDSMVCTASTSIDNPPMTAGDPAVRSESDSGSVYAPSDLSN